MGESSQKSRTAIDDTNYLGGETGILWTSSDTLGVFSDKTVNSPFLNTLTSPSGRTRFKGRLEGTSRYAYFPYSATAGSEVTSLRGKINEEQTCDLKNRYIECDYKYGVPRRAAADEFDFEHLFSLLRLNVNADNTVMAGDAVTAVAVTAPGGKVLSGNFTFNATDGSYTMDGGEGSNRVEMKLKEPVQLAPGESVAGYVSCAPDVKMGDKLTVHVQTNNHVAEFTVEAVVDFAPNNIYTFDLTLCRYDDEEHGWTVTDLPAFKSFEFTVAANPGKILGTRVQQQTDGKTVTETAVKSEVMTINGNEITGFIPYLYDFNLVPAFNVAEGITVTVGGNVQESGKSA